ncbi:ATP-dependent 6-phosphofructokinase [Mycoplasma sp. Mirounga ES2805-ORL]|uniref:ATP-dependent 6-phosphofructokinase n=1 Tax=Mycoplasma sp. Mirounga ES2805-ORL TaxID=754514 RepID=UPI00197C6731|nr:ATP-dependent 6-phosphofructokinase [Mycoplasma sp. Mirounga ES2805-ORL]QSF13631.1 6-phosphofructokinase [Mycoplasma sp. Mirounga ES2805-ORL]
MVKRIAVLTSGGDAPGMNSAIRSICKSAKLKNVETFLVYEGFKGLYEDNIINSNDIDLDFFNSRGGTCIFSARFEEFKNKEYRLKAIDNLKKRKIDALIIIGGDGSFQAAQDLFNDGFKTVGIPGTIDNDIPSSDYSIGYDTALNTVTKNIDSIRDTANSQKRIMIIEIMGNRCGLLTLDAGQATGAEVISTPEYTLSYEDIANSCLKITNEKYIEDKQALYQLRRCIIVVVTEKLYDLEKLKSQISAKTNWVTRYNVLGHLQRGGNPTARERQIASQFGTEAVKALLSGKSGIIIGMNGSDFVSIPIEKALKMKLDEKRKKIKEMTKEYTVLNSLK